MSEIYTVDEKNPNSWDEYFFEIAKKVASNSKCLSRKIGAIIALGHTIISTGYNGPSRDVCQCDKRWLIDDEIRQYVIEKGEGFDVIDNGKYDEFREMDKLINATENMWKKNPSYPHNKISMLKMSLLYKNHLKGKCPRYIPEMGFRSGQGLEWCVAGHAERNAIINAARHGLHALKGTQIYMTCGVPCTPCLVEIKNAGIEEIICTGVKDAFYDRSGKYQLKESGVKIRTFDFIKE